MTRTAEPTRSTTAFQFATRAALPELRAKGLGEIEMPPVTFDPQKDQAWVVGPQIFSMVRGVTAERREMIATSALFASLAADAQTSRDKHKEWYGTYCDALTNLGWVLTESTQQHYAQDHTGSKVHEAVLDFIAAAGVGGAPLVLIAAALKAMKKIDASSPWITLFDHQTRREEIAGFQVGLVEEKDGKFEVKLMDFTLKLDQSRTQILFIDFSTLGVEMDSMANTVTVAEDTLRSAMPALKTRLQDYVKRFVAEVPLPPL